MNGAWIPVAVQLSADWDRGLARECNDFLVGEAGLLITFHAGNISWWRKFIFSHRAPWFVTGTEEQKQGVYDLLIRVAGEKKVVVGGVDVLRSETL